VASSYRRSFRVDGRYKGFKKKTADKGGILGRQYVDDGIHKEAEGGEIETPGGLGFLKVSSLSERAKFDDQRVKSAHFTLQAYVAIRVASAPTKPAQNDHVGV
jgi:hypothetical protein